jgi:ABC-type glycerol-3-phosphate transport system substrate-binding protein
MKIRTAQLFSLLLVLTIFIFCTCGGGSNRDFVTITLNVPANANLIQSLQKDIEAYSTSSGISIKLIPFSGQEKLYAMLAAGKPPDIFYTNSVVRDKLAAEGHLADLWTLCDNDTFVQRIRSTFIEQGTSTDGGWYQFCDWTFTYGVYFNKRLFDAMGIPYPDEKWTWDDMLSCAKKLSPDQAFSSKKERYGIFIARHFLSAFERMNGTTYPKDGLFLDFPEQALEVKQAYLDLIYRHQVMPELNYVQAQGMQMSQMMNTGKIAMIVEAVPNLDFINALSVDWDIAPLPAFGTKPPAYFRAASGGLSISSACKHPEAAWAVIKFLVTQSDYNTPNPIFRDVDFVASYLDKHPMLREKNFARVWNLSEKFDGGDSRDFVRYSSWSSHTILSELSPKLDLLYAGKMSLDELTDYKEKINQRVVRELQETLKNRNIRPAFRTQIQAGLEQYGIN